MSKIGRTETVKQGIGLYLGRFYSDYFYPDTAASEEWAARGLAKSMQFAPGRLIDNADAMIEKWRANDNTGLKGTSSFLPNVIVAVGKDYTPVLGDYANQLPTWQDFIFPNDPQNRRFQMRLMQGDVRCQVAIFAAEETTAKSIAMQLCLYIKANQNRTFAHTVEFAGITSKWPVQLTTPDVSIIPIPMQEQVNLTVLTVDLMLRASVPIFRSPSVSDARDGKGNPVNPMDANNPDGFANVSQVSGDNKASKRTFMVADPASTQENPNWPKP